MRTKVDIEIEVQHFTDQQYEDILDEVEAALKDIYGMKYVYVGLGEELEEE